MPIKLENVAIGFGDRELLYPINLMVRRGELIRIRGPNGVGKTCLLRTIAGEVAPMRGTIVRSESVAYWSHEIGLFEGFSPRRLLRLLSVGHSDAVNIGFDWLHEHGIADVPMGRFSGGERGVAGLLTIAANSSALFALDEPFIGLDEETLPTAVRLIGALLKDGRGGMIVDHYGVALSYGTTYAMRMTNDRDRVMVEDS